MLTYAYGEKKDKLLYIDDVPNGAKCGCFCPCCGEPLNAHNGNIPGKGHPQHSFYHNPDSDCKGYYETTLHELGKEIISEEKSVMLPKNGILSPELLLFSNVEVEKFDNKTGKKPDCSCTTKDGWVLWVEIFVTHPVPEDKVTVIKQNNINCLEIDISKQPLDKEKVKEFIINSVENRHFINYPHGEEITKRQKEEESVEKERKQVEIRERRTRLWESKHKILRRVWKKRKSKIEEKKEKTKKPLIPCEYYEEEKYRIKRLKIERSNSKKFYQIGDRIISEETKRMYEIIEIDNNKHFKIIALGTKLKTCPFYVEKPTIDTYFVKI